MSVTFMAPEAPELLHTWICNDCGGKGCNWCDGNGSCGEWARPHTLNFSNYTAREIFRAIGHNSEDLWGEIRPENLPKWIEGCEKALIGFSDESIDAWEAKQPTFGMIDFSDSFTIASRVRRLKNLFQFANDGGLMVTWG